jgi:hypothetical protein
MDILYQQQRKPQGKPQRKPQRMFQRMFQRETKLRAKGPMEKLSALRYRSWT